MNNLLSYCGLVDAKIRASDKDLPVIRPIDPAYHYIEDCRNLSLIEDRRFP